jgi:hypothetical protein
LLVFTASVFADPIRGTLVVAVPVREGLVVCADKRLYNVDSGSISDDAVKIRQAGDRSLFVATNTVAFYDRQSRSIAFDASQITADHLNKNAFSDDRRFWTGLKAAISTKLRSYFSARPFSQWPESDRANNHLLFNLVFYSYNGDRIFSHSIRVYYEKKRMPVILVQDPVREEVRGVKLNGKGAELMRFLAKQPPGSISPIIGKFGSSRYDPNGSTIAEAVEFAEQLFVIANRSLPTAQVSATYDCAILAKNPGFGWIRPGNEPTN